MRPSIFRLDVLTDRRTVFVCAYNQREAREIAAGLTPPSAGNSPWLDHLLSTCIVPAVKPAVELAYRQVADELGQILSKAA